jgi:hypothetical protein
MHNLLKFEDEENIGKILRIIELKVVVHGEQINKNVIVASDDDMNWLKA